MNTRVVIRRSLAFLLVAVVLIFVSKLLIGRDNYKSPGLLDSYSNQGYFEFDPETILMALAHNEIDALTPFLENPLREEPYYPSIAWSQSDHLAFANALSNKVWKEPLDLTSWKALYFSLNQGCSDNLDGFHSSTIVYYKKVGISDWEQRYVTRRISITTQQGLASWGEEEFGSPLFSEWYGVNLSEFKVSADNALQIAEEHGGYRIRQEVSNTCRIILSVNNLDQQHQDDWIVDYDRAYFYMHINPFTGQYKILK